MSQELVERREEYAGSIESAVRIAIGQRREWQENVSPSSPKTNRVVVRDGDTFVTRTPIQRRGEWRVRWAGMPRLVRPHWLNGNMTFEADWS